MFEMSVLEFYDELAKHDWHYEMTDDPSVWRKGSVNHKRLLGIAKKSQQHRDMYNAWNRHIFAKGPKPLRLEDKPTPKYWVDKDLDELEEHGTYVSYRINCADSHGLRHLGKVVVFGDEKLRDRIFELLNTYGDGT